MSEICLHCGVVQPASAYCWLSPNGKHDIIDSYDDPDPYDDEDWELGWMEDYSVGSEQNP